MLTKLDDKWEDVLNKVEGFEGNEIEIEETNKMIIDLCIENTGIERINESLYLNLISYTTDDAHSLTISNGREKGMETYRYIYHKGKNSNQQTMMDRRHKVMNPEGTERIEDMAVKMRKWKMIW